MAISYQSALRVYAKKHGKFIVPKKGSAEYEEVRKIMGETEMSPEHEIKRKSKSKKVSEAQQIETSSESSVSVKGKKQSKTKMIEPPPMKHDTKIIDDPADEIEGKKILNDPEKLPKKVSGKGVNRTGKSTAIENTEMLLNSNTGPSAEISAEYPDQKDKVKKTVKKKVETTIDIEKATDKTIKSMKSDDPEALKGGSIPFSIEALRKQLRC